MGRLIYSTIASLDGYIADEDGKFDWAAPDEEVHTFVNDLARPVGTYLLGRRMYEVLAYWDDPPSLDEQPSYVQEFTELWQAADKVVFSRTLETARTARTRIEHDFDVEAIRQLKARSTHDLAVGGPELAAQAIRAGLVDEYELFVVPVLVGAGKRALPDDGRASSSWWTNAGSATAPCFSATGAGRDLGQRALEGSPVERAAVRRKHVLDRECKERAQSCGDLLARHAGGKPPLVDLEPLAEVDERVAGDHRTLALEPEHGVVRLVPWNTSAPNGSRSPAAYGRASPFPSRSSQTTSGLPSPACSAVRPYVSMRNCALSGSGV